jgi:hypothetical protein
MMKVVIPGRAKREPGISHNNFWVPGSLAMRASRNDSYVPFSSRFTTSSSCSRLR